MYRFLSFRYLLSTIFLIILGTSIGCRGRLDYEILASHINNSDCNSALSYLNKDWNYGPTERLLYLLDSASINMMCKDYKKSNDFLHKAEELSEKLWTKSISREMGAFIINDLTVDYRGEDFERALINLMSAINYASINNYDEALVEIRRLDQLLSIINSKYEKKNVYKEDAFGRYISGILYEADKHLDDAFIDYMKAYKIFLDYREDYNTPIPQTLLKDLARLAKKTGREEEIKDIAGLTQYEKPDNQKVGRIVFIHMSGKAPEKKEDKIFIPTLQGPITLAFPRYEVHTPACRNHRFIVKSPSWEKTINTEIVEDINSIALKNLNDRKLRIIAKTIVRAATKQVILNAATSQIDNEQARVAAKTCVNIVNMAVEQADTRSWQTLPGEIYMSSIFVPEGIYETSIEGCSSRENIISSFNIAAGETKFVISNDVYHN